MCSSSNGRYTAIVAIRRFFLLFFSFPLYLFLYFSTYGRTSWYSDIYGGWEPYRFPGLKSTISERERLQSFIIFTDFVPSVLFEISYYYVLYQYLCTVWIHSEGKNIIRETCNIWKLFPDVPIATLLEIPLIGNRGSFTRTTLRELPDFFLPANARSFAISCVTFDRRYDPLG